MAPKRGEPSTEWGSEGTTEIGSMEVFDRDVEISEAVSKEFAQEHSDGPHGYDDCCVEIPKERELTSSD